MYRSVLLSFVIIQLTYACYITNCPIGGKRSLSSHTHQCPSCGDNGQCFGPSICCTNSNCRIGHLSDSRQCSTENRSLSPCTIKSSACTVVPNGQCAASGICCNSESCHVDENCSIDDNLQEE